MDTILCAIDFSPETALVVRTAATLARACGARLIAFHAVHFASDPLYATDLPDRKARARRLAGEADAKLAACMDAVDLPWEPVLVRGDPVEQLVKLAAARDIDLVVTASRGVGAIQRLFVGTVVERMVRQVPRPILIIRPPPVGAGAGPKASPTRILVGCDLKPPATPLGLACLLARHFAEELHLLHVSVSPLDEALVEDEQGPAEHVLESLRDRLEQRLNNACPEARQRGVRFYTDVWPGIPAEAIRQYARQRYIDLLVVGVHRAGALKTALIGSTARELLRHVPCSLLTVPQSEGAGGGVP